MLQRLYNGKLYYMATGRGHCNVRYVHLNDVSLQPRASERASLDALCFERVRACICIRLLFATHNRQQAGTDHATQTF